MGVIMFRISGELSTASGIDQAVQLSSALTKGTLIACIVIVLSKVALFEYGMAREITGSFGIAFATPDMNWDTLYNHADRALYDAKEKGKNQYCVYSDTTE